MPKDFMMEFTICNTPANRRLIEAFRRVCEDMRAFPVVDSRECADLREVYKRLGKVWEARHA